MNYILDFPLAPGDCWALTCLLRDFSEQYPQHTLAPVTASNEIFEGNPNFHKLDTADVALRFTFGPPETHKFGNCNPRDNMVRFIYQWFNQQTGLAVHRRTMAPEFYPTDKEREYSLVPTDLPVCVINAGYKFDVPVKHWGQENFQAVVDALRDRVRLVQVGSKRRGIDFHKSLSGVTDLTGKTTLRELAQLVYHADYVLTGISQLHHLAGIQCYKPRHCITIAGGREPETWANCYRRGGVTWHWIKRNSEKCSGSASGGCWKSLCTEVPAPCMKSITPEEIIKIFKETL